VGQPLRIGIIGAGAISGAYLKTLPRLPGLQLVGVADLDADRAKAAASTADVEALSSASGVQSQTVNGTAYYRVCCIV